MTSIILVVCNLVIVITCLFRLKTLAVPRNHSKKG